MTHSFTFNSKPGRLVLACLLIPVIFFIVDRAAGWVLGKMCLSSQIRFSRVFAGNVSKDAVVLGNSRAVNMVYAPFLRERHGLDVTNLSYNGMSMETAFLLALALSERDALPKQIIVEASCLNADNELLKGLKCYYGESSALRASIRELDSKIDWGCRVSSLYRYNSEYFLRSLYYLRRDDQDWVNHYRIRPEMVSRLAEMSERPLSIPGESLVQVKAWLALQDLCREKQVKLTLVAGPYLPAFIPKMSNYTEWLLAVRQMSGPEVRWVDASRWVEVESGFADTIHLNEEGAKIVSDRLVKEGVFNASL